MKRLRPLAGVLLVLLMLIAGLIVWSNSDSSPASRDAAASPPTATPEPTVQIGGLPGRPTDTPDSAAPDNNTITPDASPPALPTAPRTPVVTSPFTFPTSSAATAPTSARDCTQIFPLASVEKIDFGVTTITQLEAAFGRAQYQSGRAARFRFEQGDCVLLVTVGVDVALDAELPHYGTLDLLLERYGEPAAVGISQGNLTLLAIDNTVLLYPDAGIIAIFEAEPDQLTRQTPITSLQFRPPYETDAQMRRLNLRPVDNWSLAQPVLPR